MSALVRTVQQLTPPRLTERPLVRVVLAVVVVVAAPDIRHAAVVGALELVGAARHIACTQSKML